MRTFSVAADAPVSAVTRLIVERENLDAQAHVRLISSGKLIRDHDTPLTHVLNEGHFLHCAISETPTQPPSRDVEQQRRNSATVVLSSTVDANGDVRILIPRSSESGEPVLSESEVAFIRRHFQRVLLRRSAVAAEQEAGARREGEEEQTDGQERGANGSQPDVMRRMYTMRPDPHNVLSSGIEGSTSDFLMGCIFGYLLGIIVLVLLLDNHATQKWRVGIVAGVATNCAFGILRTSLNITDWQLTSP